MRDEEAINNEPGAQAPKAPIAPEMTREPSTGTGRTVVIFVDRAVLWLARHWLLLFNVVFGVYAGLPVLAPLLMSWGQPRLANIIYFVYQFLCHQMPSRCFYIGRFQVGICQRDLALYGGACLAGLIFSVFRKRLRPLPVPVWLVLVAPMVLDGLTQLVGLRTSTWQLRTLSGLLASGATIWLIYPYLDQAFGEAAAEAGHQLGKIEPPE